MVIAPTNYALASKVALALGVADLLVLDLVLAPKLAHRRAREATSARSGLISSAKRPGTKNPQTKKKTASNPRPLNTPATAGTATVPVNRSPANATEPQSAADEPAPAAQASSVAKAPVSDESASATPTTNQAIAAAPDLLFRSGQHWLTLKASRTLDQIAAQMQADPTKRLILRGHTDNQGKDAANKRLSFLRAASAAYYLRKKGIPRGRMQLLGVGTTDPASELGTPQARAKNRRVQAIFVAEPI